MVTGPWNIGEGRTLGLDSVAFREPLRSHKEGSSIITHIFNRKLAAICGTSGDRAARLETEQVEDLLNIQQWPLWEETGQIPRWRNPRSLLTSWCAGWGTGSRLTLGAWFSLQEGDGTFTEKGFIDSDIEFEMLWTVRHHSASSWKSRTRVWQGGGHLDTAM